MEVSKVIITIPDLEELPPWAPMCGKHSKQRYVFQIFNKQGKKVLGGVTTDILSVLSDYVVKEKK